MVRHSRRNGSILLLVLMAIVTMSLATASYLVLMRNEHKAARNAGLQQQARLFVESAADYLCLFLDQSDDLIAQQGGVINNPNGLQGVLVADDLDESFRGRFTVIAPDVVQGYYSGIRYGLEDESSKLNINLLARDGGDETAARERLLWIPGMTEDIADAILDWIDEDNLPRAYGAEDTHYQGLNPPYQPRNGPLQSLSELLQVRGVTPELLYGLDSNRNLTVDTGEQARGALIPLDNSLGQLNRGWSAYLTVYAAERLLTPAGAPKVNVNNPDLRILQTELQQVVTAEEANFILAYRQFGPASAEAQGSTSNAASLTIDFETQPTTEINSLLDLVGARVAVQENSNGQAGTGPPSTGGQGGGQPQQPSGGSPQQNAEVKIIESPWQDSPALYSGNFLELLDNLTTTEEEARGGRININMATRPVLLTIPGISEMQADQILAMREPLMDPLTSPQRHSVWLLANGLVTLEEMKQLDPFITSGGHVYSAQIIGFFDGLPSTARARVFFDRTGVPTLLVGWEDLSHLGPGFTALELGSQMVQP